MIDPTHNQLFSSADAPFGDVVLSSRARLARNLEGFPFVNKATSDDCNEVVDLLSNATSGIEEGISLDWISLDELDELRAQLFVERHLVSSKLIQSKHPRAVAIGKELVRSVMVNEEDHIRIQCIRPGLQLSSVFEDVCDLDNRLNEYISYAFHKNLGFLTACPTNVGTGARFSVMVHLPGLKIVKDLNRIQNTCKAMSLAIRGFHGEGSKALGDIYQVSNQVTLGYTEEDLLALIADEFLPPVIEWERKARMHIIETNAGELDDRINKAIRTLKTARILSLEEAMQCLGHIRLGVTTNRVSDIDINLINQSFINIQPAHIKWHSNSDLPDQDVPKVRCELIRELLQI